MDQSRPFPTLPRRKRPQRRRVASLLAYDGGGFHGFQRQPGQRTVEGELVRALQEAGLTGGLSFASRTDTGVHARGQVVCFHVDAGADPALLQKDLQSRLPSDIRIQTLVWAPMKFHPRWTAVGKRYRYTLSWAEVAASGVWRLDTPLDSAQLAAALEELRQAPDLKGFTAAGAPDKPGPPLSTLTAVAREAGMELVFEGPAFGRYAIRHMVGAVVAQTRGELPQGSCTQIAGSAGPYRGLRAPADGLVLEEVYFPRELHPFEPTTGSR